MSSLLAQPLTKPAPDRTFAVAIGVLGAVAVAQVLAVIIVFLPEMRLASSDARTPEQPVASGSGVTGAEAAPSQALIQQANAMLEQADRARSAGDLDGALNALAEADHLIPNEPGVLFQMAVANYESGREVEAVELAKRVLALPATSSNPAYAQIGQQTRAFLTSMGGSSVPAGGSAAGTPAEKSTRMRDEVGIPIGSALGIVDCRLLDGAPGVKNLRIAIKAAQTAGVAIDPGALKVVVYFYENNDRGEVMQTSSNLISQWLSSPIDWANNEPELLEVNYPMPLDDRGDLPPMQYHGYVVGIYYKGELQDERAEPVSLLEQFPLKLSVAEDER